MQALSTVFCFRNAVLGENYVTHSSVACLGGYQRSYSTCREILTLLLRTKLLPYEIVCYTVLHNLWAAWAGQTSSRWNGFNGRSGEVERGMLISCLTFLCTCRCVLLNEQMKTIICIVISVPTCVEGERLSISAQPSLVLLYICTIATIEFIFQSASNILFVCGVKSQDGFRLDLQSLTPYSFVSIKTLEHSAGFGFEVLCAFV